MKTQSLLTGKGRNPLVFLFYLRREKSFLTGLCFHINLYPDLSISKFRGATGDPSILCRAWWYSGSPGNIQSLCLHQVGVSYLTCLEDVSFLPLSF